MEPRNSFSLFPTNRVGYMRSGTATVATLCNASDVHISRLMRSANRYVTQSTLYL